MAGFRAAVFRGSTLALEDLVGAATVGCLQPQRAAYFRELSKHAGVKAMSEALLLAWAPPAGMEPMASQAEVRIERPGLFADKERLWTELERLLLAVGLAEAEEPLYELDWGEGVAAAEADSLLPKLPSGTAASSGSKRKTKVSKELKEEFTRSRGFEGATWTDILQMPGSGFSPPVLCDVAWRKVTGPLKGAKAAVPHVYSKKSRYTPFQLGLVEMMSCQLPEQVVQGLKTLGCKDKVSFDGSGLTVLRNWFQSSSGIPLQKVYLNKYDVLVLPLTGYQGQGTAAAVDMPFEVLTVLQTILKQVQQRAKPARIVLLTCGSIGPGYVDWHGAEVPAAAAALGLVRTLRREVPQVPLLWIDTDALGAHGAAQDFVQQLAFELEVATPQAGIWGVSTAERALWLMGNNRDVAYRNGQRFLNQVDLSPRMPIFLGREAPALPRATAEGAVLVTGGVGGIGLVAAEALAEAGARCLVLSSRSGDFPKGLGIEERIAAMQARGVNVVVEKCDTSKDKSVRELLERLRESIGAVTGVVHTSGLMADKAVTEMDGQTLRRVFDPKAHGAWNLHRQTLDDDVSTFVLFSSTTALRGSRGQANYAAANAYLDELARLRVSQGLPAVSVQWPAVELSGAPVPEGISWSVSLDTVKQVVKQLVCGHEATEPVQAVLPTGYLVPSPQVRSSLEPLLEKASPPMRQRLEDEAAAKMGRKG